MYRNQELEIRKEFIVVLKKYLFMEEIMTGKIFIEQERYKKHRRVFRRYEKWMYKHWRSDANPKDKFKWTEENVQKLFALNDAIIEKENKLFKLFSDVKNDMENLLATGHSYYENYDIDAYLSYEADKYVSLNSDDNTMHEVYEATEFCYCNALYTSAGRPLKTMEEELNRDTNYNYTWAFRSIPYREHYISRFLYDLVQQGTYTIEDLLYLNPKYFVECIEIRN